MSIKFLNNESVEKSATKKRITKLIENINLEKSSRNTIAKYLNKIIEDCYEIADQEFEIIKCTVDVLTEHNWIQLWPIFDKYIHIYASSSFSALAAYTYWHKTLIGLLKDYDLHDVCEEIKKMHPYL